MRLTKQSKLLKLSPEFRCVAAYSSEDDDRPFREPLQNQKWSPACCYANQPQGLDGFSLAGQGAIGVSMTGKPTEGTRITVTFKVTPPIQTWVANDSLYTKGSVTVR